MIAAFGEGRPRHPALITGSVMLASLLYSMDWSIAAVALPHMQGTFSATQDQISWVITSYIVASAIMIPTAGWLSTRFGRKRVFVWALSIFTVASVFCGAADTLTMEVLARIAQGMGGAFLIPLSHSVILDTYPPEEHGKAMALWGAGSVLGTMIGPTVGGYLTDLLSWRYIFYINVPFGLVALLGVLAFVPETERDPGRRLDWLGFISLAIGIGALQMMLDRGERLDWFESGEILFQAGVALVALYVFAMHTLTARDPFLDPRLIGNRQFFLTLVLISFYGFLTVPVMVLMPAFMDHLLGYPIATIGLLQTPRGIGLLIALIVSGRITGKVDPRALIAFGLVCLAVSSWEMSRWSLDVGDWPIVWTGFVQGVGAGILLVPIQVLAFPGLAPHQRTEAAAVFNLVRSVCSSVGVSLTLAFYVSNTAVSRSQMVEYVTPFSPALQPGVGPRFDADSLQGLAILQREIDRQAAMISYNADFFFLALAALVALPLLLFVGKPRLGAAQDREGEAYAIAE
jgi:MFS transporter, DHA2 family, multidrug resistance protein